MQATGEDHVWLDATMIDDFQRHFPTIWFSCLRADLDPTTDWLPVAPAAHYLSGGVVTDLDGATTLDAPLGVRRGRVQRRARREPARVELAARRARLRAPRRRGDRRRARTGAESTGAMTGVLDLAAPASPRPIRSCCRRSTATEPDAVRGALQRVMSSDCGVVRDAEGLRLAIDTLGDLAAPRPTTSRPATIASYEVIDLLRVVARDRRVGDGPHGVARRAHRGASTPTVRRAARPVRRPRGDGVPSSSRCPASSPRGRR